MSRAVVVDDWALVRAGAEAVLRRTAFPRVVVTSSATAAIAAVRDRSKPVSLAVIGAATDMGQREVVKAMAGVDGLGIIVLLATIETQAVMEVLESGAHAVVERHARDLDLPSAIEHVREGQRYVSPQLLGGLFDNPTLLQPVNRPTFDLTPRERDVLAELVAGRTNAEIAQRLAIAPETVKTHLTNLYAKLDVKRRSHAVGVAVRHQLV
jgi:DNA-binding NarL/FixJ family response regulator